MAVFLRDLIGLFTQQTDRGGEGMRGEGERVGKAEKGDRKGDRKRGKQGVTERQSQMHEVR